MANQKISELTAIATIDNATDVLPIVDTSATTTKKITLTQVKTSLALNNVDNTSDANKPVSSATQTALDSKQSALGYTPLNKAGDTIAGDINNSSTGYFQLPAGTTAQRPVSPVNGMRRYNTTTARDEFYAAGVWQNHARLSGDTFTGPIDATNLSGTNTGDNATNSQYSGLAASKQDTLVSATNIKTINSTSLLGAGDITISASSSGVSGAIQFSNGSAFASDATNFFWDNTNKRLGIGTNAPTATTHFKGSGSTSATTSLLVQNSAGTASLQVSDDGSVYNLGKGAVTSNSAFGRLALNTNTSGANNTANGAQSLQNNTTGSANTADGVSALASNLTGSNNTAVGRSTLTFMTAGSANTAVGAVALYSTTASNNTAVGYEAAFNNTTGANNSLLGQGTITGNFSGSVILGKDAAATASNQFVVGSAGTIAGSVTAEVNTSANVWNVIINGVARKILLA